MGKGYNHYEDCECGWCGGPRVKRTAEEQAIIEKYLFDSSKYESFLRPNAICPVCGERVYFFQSKNGGRVFFDDVGPPWPKHPCTDNSEYNGFNKFHYQPAIEFSETVKAKWLDDGWQPFNVTNKWITHWGWGTPTCHIVGHMLSQRQVEFELVDFEQNFSNYFKDLLFIKQQPNYFLMAAISVGDKYSYSWKAYKSYEDFTNRKLFV